MRHFTFLLIIFLFVLPVAAQEDVAQRNKEAYRDALSQASSGNPVSLFQLYADPYQSNQGGVTLQETSIINTEAFGNALWAAIPDLQITPDVLIAQDDWVATSVTYSGTFTESFNFSSMESPSTNRSVQWKEMNFLRFNTDGKIIESWVISNPTVMLTQLGVMPAQPAGGPPTTNSLTDPVGYKTLSADELSATFTSETGGRNVAAWQEILKDIVDTSPVYADTFVQRTQSGLIHEVDRDNTSNGNFIGLLFTAMPDLEATPDILVAEGDWVASLVTFKGTFINEISVGPMTLKPTSETITWQAGFIDRFNADVKVVEEWTADNPIPLMQGIGLMPSAPEQ